MAIPSYSLTATSTTVTFHIDVTTGYTYYRLFIRRTDSSDMIVSGLPFYDVMENFAYTVSGLDPNTSYTANVYYSTDSTVAENKPIGAQSITTASNARPSNWAWTTTIAKGATVPKYGESLAPITAVEWNEFCNRINMFREYKAMGVYSFTIVSKGAPMTSAIVNQAITAITAILGHGTLPIPSNAISASFWQQLADALNDIT